MPTEPNEDNAVKKQVIAKMKAMFPEGSFEPRHPSPENIRQSRFGFSMILLGIIALIGGAYPLPTDPANRAIMLVAGLIYAFVGAWKIDRANRELKRPRQSKPGP